jgi:hypothetical protein
MEQKELLLHEQTKQERLKLIFTGLVLLLLAILGFLSIADYSSRRR